MYRRSSLTAVSLSAKFFLVRARGVLIVIGWLRVGGVQFVEVDKSSSPDLELPAVCELKVKVWQFGD